MDKDKPYDDCLDLEWQDELLDLDVRGNSCIGGYFEYKDIDIFTQDLHQKSPQKYQKQIYSPLLKQQTVTQIQQEQEPSQQTLKRQHFDFHTQQNSSKNIHNKNQQFETHTQSTPKDAHNGKQHVYSKVYRQKKKQRYRILQQQNQYLKKRIHELQSQLREQEIQLNRFKFPPPQKELSIEELNKELVQVSSHLLKDLKSQPDQYKKQSFPTGGQLNKFFLQSYAERGFAGKKKLKILNYHFNQILESVLKDSEKYLSLIYFNSKSYDNLVPLSQFQSIKDAYMDVFKPEDNLWTRLKTFHKFLKPMTLQLNKQISLFYKKYEEILGCCDKIHNFLKETYLTNMDVARRRLQVETWFDFYKYGKMMRRLRYQWFQWMKTLATKEQQEAKTAKKGSKIKK